MYVIGMGEEKTSRDTVSAYDKFSYLDILFHKDKNGGKEKPGEIVPASAAKPKRTLKIHADKYSPPVPPADKTKFNNKPPLPADAAAPANNGQKTGPAKIPSGFVEEIVKIIDDWSDDGGWANLANVGNMLSKRNPDFDSRNYGFKKLADMVQHISEIEVKLEPEKKICFVKIKDKEGEHHAHP
jgi:hypothetical protein